MTSQTLSADIEKLYETYLNLLNQYDTLRKSLSNLQVSAQQKISRANFYAPRGIRYGEELYDARMQATRLCSVTGSGNGTAAAFTVSATCAERGQPVSKDTTTREDEVGEDTNSLNNGSVDVDGADAKTGTRNVKDPIRMFGILTPQALRLAQGESIKMVEQIIPKLVSVDAAMKDIEIAIRRARKHRARADAKRLEDDHKDGLLKTGRGEVVLST